MELQKRKQMRLQGYNYSQSGAYFITFCVKDKHELLGEIDVGEHSVLPKLSEIGKITETAIKNIYIIYESVKIEKYVIMPNHVHMIIIITNNGGSTMCSPTISRVIKQCKEYVTKQIGYSVWQTSYHDHIIRDEEDYQKIWQYIDTNPLKWELDCYYTK